MGEVKTESDLDGWIGRTCVGHGLVTQEICQRLRATIDPVLLPEEIVPLGMHWCIALDSIANHGLGPDGHPAKGGFLPPVPLPSRMWASGEIEFRDPLQVGDAVERHSTVSDIKFKDGRSGPLCFVTVDHSWLTQRGPAILEKQHIVYRDAVAAPAQARPAPISGTGQASNMPVGSVCIVPDAAMLFRYSAMTFNAHRIHYDRDYAVEEEHYPERVVHGPLQATLLMNRMVDLHGPISDFSFRAMRPAFAYAPLVLDSTKAEDGFSLRTIGPDGGICMEATAHTAAMPSVMI
ncbi:MAG: MaoC family dehydratase N-terminal domain-containing protein [Novosphingobium sp.]